MYAFAGLGAFCGPVMDLAASWKDQVVLFPGFGAASGYGYYYANLLFVVFGAGVLVFTFACDGNLTTADALYASLVTGKFQRE